MSDDVKAAWAVSFAAIAVCLVSWHGAYSAKNRSDRTN